MRAEIGQCNQRKEKRYPSDLSQNQLVKWTAHYKSLIFNVLFSPNHVDCKWTD